MPSWGESLPQNNSKLPPDFSGVLKVAEGEREGTELPRPGLQLERTRPAGATVPGESWPPPRQLRRPQLQLPRAWRCDGPRQLWGAGEGAKGAPPRFPGTWPRPLSPSALRLSVTRQPRRVQPPSGRHHDAPSAGRAHLGRAGHPHLNGLLLPPAAGGPVRAAGGGRASSGRPEPAGVENGAGGLPTRSAEPPQAAPAEGAGEGSADRGGPAGELHVAGWSSDPNS